MRRNPMPVVTTQKLYDSDTFIVTGDYVNGEPASLLIVHQPTSVFTTLEHELLEAFSAITHRWQRDIPEQAEVEACLESLIVGGQPLCIH
jgi:tetrahydromethanopterin S-methyltransferase subunit A